METYLEDVQRMLQGLEEQRRHIDADIRDLRAIIERHGRGPAVRRGYDRLERALASRTQPNAGATSPTGKGEASRAVLEMMADGAVWRPSEIAQVRGTSQNAASAVLRRLLREGHVNEVGTGKYRIASPKGHDAQGSLSDESEGEDHVHPQASEGVVDEMTRATA